MRQPAEPRSDPRSIRGHIHISLPSCHPFHLARIAPKRSCGKVHFLAVPAPHRRHAPRGHSLSLRLRLGQLLPADVQARKRHDHAGLAAEESLPIFTVKPRPTVPRSGGRSRRSRAGGRGADRPERARARPARSPTGGCRRRPEAAPRRDASADRSPSPPPHT